MSPPMEFLCTNCHKLTLMQTSSTTIGGHAYTSFLLLILIVFTGSTYSKVHQLFGLLGMKIASEDFYHKTVLPDLEKATQEVFDEFMASCRNQTADKQDMHIVIDAGWSHPGWWARECTIVALDGSTGLPIAVKHVQKGSSEYSGSSKG